LCTTNDYCQDIEKCEKILPETTLFRPPYGKIYPWQINQLKKKYRIILWDVLSYDFKKNITPEELKSNVLDNIDNGSIVVFHDNIKSEKNLKESLREILVEIKNQGFRFKLFSSDTKEI
jgi:peptidoglycan/xylan/chitin deacetylase (PgdA/CDA1 family)